MSTKFPNLGLSGEFAPCEDAVTQINENFKILDNLLQAGVDGLVASLPGSPSEGDAVILSGTNQVNVYSDGSWTAYTPQQGWAFIDTTDYSLLIFDGSTWIKKPLPNDFTNFVINMANLGGGAEVFKQLVAGIAEFRTLVAGSGISVSETADEIIIQSTALTDAVNVTDWLDSEGLFVGVNGSQQLEFKSLRAGPGISLDAGPNDIRIIATGSTAINSTISSNAGPLTFTLFNSNTRKYFPIDNDPFSPITFNLSDPTTTPVGREVVIKVVSGTSDGSVSITAAGGNQLEQNNSTAGVALPIGPTTVGPLESVTYVNDGTKWLLVQRIKY